MARVGVYLIRAHGGMSKVGVSGDPTKRLRQLQTASPVPLSIEHVRWCDDEREARATEARWHHMLALWHVRGEWFELGEQEVLDFVNNEIPLLASLRAIEQSGQCDPFASPTSVTLPEGQHCACCRYANPPKTNAERQRAYRARRQPHA